MIRTSTFVAVLAAALAFAQPAARADVPPALMAQTGGAPPGYYGDSAPALQEIDHYDGPASDALTRNFFNHWDDRQRAVPVSQQTFEAALDVLQDAPLSDQVKQRLTAAIRDEMRRNDAAAQERQQYLEEVARQVRFAPLTSEQYLAEMNRLNGTFSGGVKISEEDWNFLQMRRGDTPEVDDFIRRLRQGELQARGALRAVPKAPDDIGGVTGGTGQICRSPCGWEALGLSVAEITATIAAQYGGNLGGLALAYIGPFSASAQPRLLDAFSSWTERFQPELDNSIRLNSGNFWHMLVSDQYVPGLVTTFDPRGLDQLPTEGARIVGGVYAGTTAQDAVLLSVANGQNLALLGARALTQAGLLPLHVFLQWDAGVRDLDLHATGPLGAGRFHVYFASRGSLALAPNTFLHADCICEGGSEVITVNSLNPGGVYRFSVFNFGNQSQTSTQLSDSAMTLSVVSGGTVVDRTAADGARGSAVSGGTVVLQPLAPPRGVAGNTWEAIEIDPNTGAILSVNRIVNSANSAAVR
ncbi:MAG: hypothetical protein ACK4QW_08605 [Alphaproteobacteria bacterium]